MSEPRFVDHDPEAVFTALADDTRIGILRALWEAEGHEATFSELRAATGVADSGRFNYHLDKLVGRFVRKTDDGYELAQAGMEINGALEAGAYTMEGSIEPIPLEDSCETCGGTRTLSYEDETVRVECEGCPVSSQFGVPPGAFTGYDREAIPEVASRYLKTTFQGIENGFCPFCDGRVEPTVGPITEINPREEAHEEFPDDLAARIREFPLIGYDCRRCGARPTCGLGLALSTHPAVVGFHDAHGIDVRERPVWTFTDFDPDRTRIRSREPFRASVSYRLEGDELTLVVNGDREVVGVEREG